MTTPVESYDKAIQHFDKALKLNPRMRQAYLNRGVIYAKRREDEGD